MKRNLSAPAAPPSTLVHCKKLVLLAALALMFACANDEGAPGTPAHPWINPPAAVDEKSVSLAAWLIYRVEDSTRAEAIEMLKSEPYIQISPGMASHFAGREVRVPAEMRPFLVRAVAAPQAEITVLQSMRGLWVRSHQPPGATVDATPIVVFIDPTPQDIFVSAE